MDEGAEKQTLQRLFYSNITGGGFYLILKVVIFCLFLYVFIVLLDNDVS